MFVPDGSTGRLCACPFLGACRALLYGEVFQLVHVAGVFFGRRMTSEYHFPEKSTNNLYVLWSIAVPPQPGWFEYAMKSKFDGTRVCQLRR